MTLRHCLLTISVLVIVSTAIHLTGTGASLELRTSTSGLTRVLTALSSHLAHWSTGHLAWDLGAFALLAILIQRSGVSVRAFWATVGFSAMAIPLVVSGSTELTSYRGLSGIDSAIFALLATHLVLTGARDGDRLTTIISGAGLIGFLAKVMAELSGAGPLFAQDLGGASPVPVAHLAGAAIGLFCGWFANGIHSRHRLPVAPSDRSERHADAGLPGPAGDLAPVHDSRYSSRLSHLSGGPKIVR